MEHIIDRPARIASAVETDTSRPAYEAYRILHLAFIVAPIVAGLDKFFNVLVNWEQYLPPFANNLVGGHGHELMLAVGVIEMVAGIGVALKPKIFAYVVSVWLLLIVVNLLMIPGYYDVALRDFGLALGALALARLSHEFQEREDGPSSGSVCMTAEKSEQVETLAAAGVNTVGISEHCG